MAEEDDLARLQDLVYEAAIIPERWPDALQAVTDFSETAGIGLLSMNERGIRIVASPVLHDIGHRVVNEGWMNKSGRANGVISKGLVGLPRFVNEDDYFDEGDLEKDPIVTELFRPAGFGWAAGFLLQLPHQDTILFNVEQYQERGPIRGESLRRLDALYAPLARAATLAARSSLDRVRTSIETLTAIGLPAAALAPTGRVVLANHLFDAAGHIWTTRLGDRIGLRDAVADRQLTQALTGDGVLSIPIRQSLGGDVIGVIQTVPIRREANDIFGRASCIVILSEMKGGEADASLVQSLFDLTPAELAVARGIAAGQTVSGIAAANGRSVHTVRGQLKSIMSKTGSTRQAELVLLMHQLSRISR
ncbi:helix-turn-helix transcriptional regulator [Devosia sp. SL43]|uniref:helix-turn-helix transcriptional regulator n=1 Tax=Devosia sp. SL43 TaxID=2806348 RepID=UPI001F2DDD7F|nr:helix-turn-helix transcriptional regulator [Devosia sp. SL43]UJW87539.1 helix-turn-helix transcriptional regulator [Devosia sp. SL43]